MGSGVWPLAMATRPAIPFPGRGPWRAHGFGPWAPAGAAFRGLSCEKEEEVSVGRWGPASRFGGDRFAGQRVLPLCAAVGIKANRAISTGQLNGLLRFHLRPIDVVVFHGSRRDLVLRRVSRLDAFSGYPVRT